MPESGVARSAGLEPTTQGLEIPCSIQLSYERKNGGPKDGKVNLGSREVNPGRRPRPGGAVCHHGAQA
jgi:hypothetical protein